MREMSEARSKALRKPSEVLSPEILQGWDGRNKLAQSFALRPPLEHSVEQHVLRSFSLALLHLSATFLGGPCSTVVRALQLAEETIS